MISEIEYLIKDTGCGIFLLEEDIDEYLKKDNIYLIKINADDVSVYSISEFLREFLKKYNVSSLKELSQKENQKGKRLVVVFEDIDKLNFDQLKGFENLCKEAKGNYTLLIVGSPKIRDLIDSLYLKNLRQSADILEGCGILKKEDIIPFSKKILKNLTGKEIDFESGVENLLLKASSKNEKKLEKILKQVHSHIKGDILKKEHLKDFIEEEEPKSKEVYKEKEEKTEGINIEDKSKYLKYAGVFLAVVFMFSVFFLKKSETSNTEKENLTVENSNLNKGETLTTLQTGDNDFKTVQDNQQVSQNDQITQNKIKDVQEEEEKPDMYFPLRRTVVLRENPDKNSKIVARLRGKKLFQMVERQDNWIKIYYKTGNREISGWINKKYLVKVPYGKAVIIARSLNLREHPSLQSKILTSIPYGTVVDVLDTLTVENRKWFKVMYIDDKGNIYEGWVSGKFVIYNKETP